MKPIALSQDLSVQYAQAEATAFETWVTGYAAKVPPPAPPAMTTLLSWRYWHFWALGVLGLFGMLLTAMRTGLRFYEAAHLDLSHLSDVGVITVGLAIVEALAAVVAIDLALPVLAAVWAYQRLRRGVSLNSAWEQVKIGGAILLALAIVIVAGLGQAINFSQELTTAYGLSLETALVLMLGGGVGFVTLLIGDLAGGAFAQVAHDNTQAEAVYRDDLAAYREARQRAWEASPQYASLQKIYKSLELQTRKSIKEGWQPDLTRPTPIVQPVYVPGSPIPKEDPKRQHIYTLIEQILDQTGEVPEYADLKEIIGRDPAFHASDGYISETRNRYLDRQVNGRA